jgi:hypothetical protein
VEKAHDDSATRFGPLPGIATRRIGVVGRPDSRLESLRGASARIQETSGDDVREVSVTELRGIPSFPTMQLDQRLEILRVVDQAVWTKAHQREAAIRDALHGDGSMTTRI